MKSFLVFCHYEGIFRSVEEDLVYIKGERRVVLIDKNITLDKFDHIRHVSGCESSSIKIIYFFKCKATSVCTHLPVQKDLTVMLYLHDICIGKISICVSKIPSQTSSPLVVETKENCVPNMNEEYMTMKAMIRICTSPSMAKTTCNTLLISSLSPA